MTTKNIKRNVRESEKNYWIVAMDKKWAMNNFRSSKHVIRKAAFYDSSKGSALQFEARVGCLRTRSYKARYGNQDACACCGKAKETMDHVLWECEEIKPFVYLGTSPNKLLGFSDYQRDFNGPTIENIGIEKISGEKPETNSEKLLESSKIAT